MTSSNSIRALVDVAMTFYPPSSLQLHVDKLPQLQATIEGFLEGKIAYDAACIASHNLVGCTKPVEHLKAIIEMGPEPIPVPDDFNDKCPSSKHRHKTRPWSQYEDMRLLAGIYKNGIENWTAISKFVGNARTRSQCSQRWYRGLDPAICKDQWTKEEEQRLIDVIAENGDRSWTQIASKMKNRSDVQCRYKYKQLQKERAKEGQILTPGNAKGPKKGENYERPAVRRLKASIPYTENFNNKNGFNSQKNQINQVNNPQSQFYQHQPYFPPIGTLNPPPTMQYNQQQSIEFNGFNQQHQNIQQTYQPIEMNNNVIYQQPLYNNNEFNNVIPVLNNNNNQNEYNNAKPIVNNVKHEVTNIKQNQSVVNNTIVQSHPKISHAISVTHTNHSSVLDQVNTIRHSNTLVNHIKDNHPPPVEHHAKFPSLQPYQQGKIPSINHQIYPTQFEDLLNSNHNTNIIIPHFHSETQQELLNDHNHMHVELPNSPLDQKSGETSAQNSFHIPHSPTALYSIHSPSASLLNPSHSKEFHAINKEVADVHNQPIHVAIKAPTFDGRLYSVY